MSEVVANSPQGLTGKYKQYPEYKDSGVEWVGDMPRHWQSKPAFAVVMDECIKNSDGAESNVLSLSYGNIVERDVETNFGLLPESFNTYQIVNPGDIILRLTDLQNDKRSLRVGRSTLQGIITSAYLKLSCSGELNDRYAYRLLHSYDTTKVFYGMGGGLRQSMKFEDFRRLPFLVPPLEEQRTIAAFLDHETARIDRLIAQQQRLIELLKEKRQAVISHAVTKGLNPNAPMKDSGVEWLGQVPEHWIVGRVKHMSNVRGGYAFSSSDFVETGVQLIKIGNLYQSRLQLDREPTFLPPNHAETHSMFLVHHGDLLMSLTGTLGKRDYGFAVQYDSPISSLLNQRVGKFLPDRTKVDSEFLLLLLLSDNYLTQIYSMPSGTKQANLSNSDVLSPWVCFPRSKDEQHCIVKYVQEQTEKLDNCVNNAESAINLLQERRTALISAAVTGKIDLRGWTPPAEEAAS